MWLDAETTPVDKKRVNSYFFKHVFFWWSSATKKIARKPPEMLFLTRYYCHVFKISRLAPQNKNSSKPRFARSWLLFTPNDSNNVNSSASLQHFSWIIFTTDELVGRRKFRFNYIPEWLRRGCFMKIICRRQNSLSKNIPRRQDFSKKMRRWPDFLTKSWQVVCPIDIVCNLFSRTHSSKSSSCN